jgi:hypothetical protein
LYVVISYTTTGCRDIIFSEEDFTRSKNQSFIDHNGSIKSMSTKFFDKVCTKGHKKSGQTTERTSGTMRPE